MALLRINPKTTELEIHVGVLEEYKPDREIKAINKALKALKKRWRRRLRIYSGRG